MPDWMIVIFLHGVVGMLVYEVVNNARLFNRGRMDEKTTPPELEWEDWRESPPRGPILRPVAGARGAIAVVLFAVIVFYLADRLLG